MEIYSKDLLVSKPVFPISFKEEWVPSALFSSIFIFCDIFGNNLHEVANSNTYFYTYKNKEKLSTVDDLSNLFLNCTQLLSIALPKSLNGIIRTSGMFSGCTSLNSITLPTAWDTISFVGNLFYNCNALESIELPKSWGNISSTNDMFYNCFSLKTITLPSIWGNVTHFRDMFYNCTSFKSQSAGTLISINYYKSPSAGIFPSECYRSDLGLNF